MKSMHPNHAPARTHWLDKRLLVLMLIAYVALVVGCTGGGTPVDADYKTGTGTLELSFDYRFPPSTLTETQQSAVVVVAKNTGGYSITGGKLMLTTDDSVLYLGSKEQFDEGAHAKSISSLVTSSSPFYGKSTIAPTGEQKSFQFNMYALPLPQESQHRSATITAYACFQYQTIQHASVCVDFDPYSASVGTGSDAVKPTCSAQDISMDSGGGPVNVGQVQTRIDKISDQEIVPNFYFTISAPSNLKMFAPGDEQKFCDAQQIFASTHDTVYFRATLSDQPLTCDGLTLVSSSSSIYSVPLLDNTAHIQCHTTQSIFRGAGGAVGNYMAPLVVNMTYGVVSTAAKTVTVNVLTG